MKLVNYKQNILHKRKIYMAGAPFEVEDEKAKKMMAGNPNILVYDDGFTPEPEPEPEPKYADLEEMTKDEIVAELDEFGVAFDGRSRKSVLAELLAEARKLKG